MTPTIETAPAIETGQQRLSLARITGGAGLVTLLVVLGASFANDYDSASNDMSADESVAFFRSIDDSLGAISAFATAVGLIAMLWFALGVALLLRRYEGELPWRSVFLAGAGVVSVVSGQIASWDAAAYRSADIDPQVARYAYDLGNLSFANSWVATGAVAICAGAIILSSRSLPHWLGWWGLVAGIGMVLARAIWEYDIAWVPFAAYWLWVAALSVMLVMGRFAVATPDR